jgi:hypothetical protein
MKKVAKAVVVGLVLGSVAILGGCAKRCGEPCERPCAVEKCKQEWHGK